MATPFESAQLILKLFELRRDPLLREARNWFIREFHPQSIEDVKKVIAGPNNPKYRMVIGYWDMACSMVTHGAIDRQMFLDANGEIFATFAKIHPILKELREMAPLPGVAKHIEQLVLSVPDVEPRLEALRQRFRALASPPLEITGPAS